MVTVGSGDMGNDTFSPSSGRQQEMSFTWSRLQLAGTLHLPGETSPYPAVLMLQGSGPDDRDSAGYFVPIRNAFLSRDIATFSFDKPGIGESTGDWHAYDLAARTEQAIAALGAIRAHGSIDSRRIGVWGHSQGGWIAQMLAARLPNLAFAIANSGPAISVERQNLAGCEHTLRAKGTSEADIAASLEFLHALHDAARREEDFNTVEARLLQRARDQPWYGYLSLQNAADWQIVSRLVRENFEPIDALERASCPFLAIFGALDQLVPAWESAELSSLALRRAGNGDTCVIVFPTGDHRIQEAGTEDFVVGYLDMLGDWAARHVAVKPPTLSA